VIWFSERDGYAHLYRFDGHGNLRNRITSGAWTVGDLLSIDEATDRLYFTAGHDDAGRRPAEVGLLRRVPARHAAAARLRDQAAIELTSQAINETVGLVEAEVDDEPAGDG
jgi:hypothetical protein